MNKKLNICTLIAMAILVSNQAFAQDSNTALAGKRITISPGHGISSNDNGTGWAWQRDIGHELGPNDSRQPDMLLCEDKHDYEWVTDFLRPMLERAGAETLMMRAYSYTESSVTVSYTDKNAYTETGTWEKSQTGDYRYSYVTKDETATASWSFEVPKDGYYPVYVRYFTSDNRVKDAQFKIEHARGESVKFQDMSVKRIVVKSAFSQDETMNNKSQLGGLMCKNSERESANLWRFLGMYPFKAHEKYKVVLSNASSSELPENVVIADSIKVGDGPGIKTVAGKTSGFFWWQEGAKNWLEFVGLPAWTMSGVGDTWIRPLYSLYEEADAQIALHTNAAGAGGPQTYVWYHLALNKEGKYVLDYKSEDDWESNFANNHLPPGTYHYAKSIDNNYCNYIKEYFSQNNQNLSCNDRDLMGCGLGEIEATRHAWYYNKNNNPLIIPTALIETAYHDVANDIRLIRDMHYRFIGARALTAGIIKHFNGDNAVIPPMPPTNLVVTTDTDHLNLSWEAVKDVITKNSDPTEYRIYTSDDGLLFDVDPVLTVKDTKAELPLLHGQTLYVRVTAANAAGESLDSRVGVGRLPNIDQKKVLYVDGVDRELKTAYDPENDRSYTRIYAPAILFNHAEFGMDSVDDEAAPALLADHSYDLVVWNTGQTNASPEVLTPEQKETIKKLRDKGTPLLLSGSEIGYTLGDDTELKDTEWLASIFGAEYTSDSAYNDVVKAVQKVKATDFIKDDVIYSSCIAYGAAVGHEAVDAGCIQYPDVFNAVNGASVIMNYVGSDTTQTGAAVISADKKAILAGFPLESIADPNQRVCLIANLLSKLMGESINETCTADIFEPDDEICDNQLDDDGNGKADCDDPACQTLESCQIPDPGDNPDPGDTPDSGDHPDPGDTPDSGDHPDPGDTSDPGDNPDPGDTSDPGDNPDPGDTPDSGETPESGEQIPVSTSHASDCSISPQNTSQGTFAAMLLGLLGILGMRQKRRKFDNC